MAICQHSGFRRGAKCCMGAPRGTDFLFAPLGAGRQTLTVARAAPVTSAVNIGSPGGAVGDLVTADGLDERIVRLPIDDDAAIAGRPLTAGCSLKLQYASKSRAATRECCKSSLIADGQLACVRHLESGRTHRHTSGDDQCRI